MSIEVCNSHKAESVPYMEGFALCCCKVSANLCKYSAGAYEDTTPCVVHGECDCRLQYNS